MARAIWKGVLEIADLEVPVKMYSAVQDRDVHFRLLGARSRAPIHQKIVRKSDGKEVPSKDRRKAFPIDRDRGVILTPEELDAIEPKPSREIQVCRFVAPSLIGDQWYERPYYLGPQDDAGAYFALVEALERKRVVGIARWAMRKKRYVGALGTGGGYLMMVTLRRADQVLSPAALDVAREHKVDQRELKLAVQLIDSIAADFEPQLWQDQYRARVCKLIEAKAQGKAIPKPPPKPKASENLADQLRQSVSSIKERKVA